MGHGTARRAIARTVLAPAGAGLAFIAFGPARPHEARGADNLGTAFGRRCVRELWPFTGPARGGHHEAAGTPGTMVTV
jgi:hypothetical protein